MFRFGFSVSFVYNGICFIGNIHILIKIWIVFKLKSLFVQIYVYVYVHFLESLWHTFWELASIIEELQPLLEHFNTIGKSNSETFAFWLEYCHRVFLLLEFLAAERDSKCIQHIEAFQQMICYDAAFDNYKYFKWGIVFLLDMNNLSSTRPDLYEMFLCGYHTVSRKKTKSSFNCVSTDVALEQSFKKDTKTKGTK